MISCPTPSPASLPPAHASPLPSTRLCVCERSTFPGRTAARDAGLGSSFARLGMVLREIKEQCVSQSALTSRGRVRVVRLSLPSLLPIGLQRRLLSLQTTATMCANIPTLRSSPIPPPSATCTLGSDSAPFGAVWDEGTGERREWKDGLGERESGPFRSFGSSSETLSDERRGTGVGAGVKRKTNSS